MQAEASFYKREYAIYEIREGNFIPCQVFTDLANLGKQVNASRNEREKSPIE
jgi:hypothetical protein